ncbi:MAG: phosphatase PAP2 family protein [Clostridia bacterium]|nr:phosphatase PAP2 family protein [Clostridia bacterium]
MQQIDMAIIEWIRDTLVCDALTPFFKCITYFGEFGWGWILIAVGLLFFKKTRRVGLTMGVALVMGVLLGELLLKNLIQRPRPFTHWPEMQLLIAPPSGFSCPSGHTTASFAAATSVFLRNKKWGIAALALAVLVGFSRMYFAVHFLTDVLFGILLGAACGLVAWKLTGRLNKKADRREVIA